MTPYEVQRYSYRSTKILWDTPDELVRKLNALRAREIVTVAPGTPDETTTKNCAQVFYSYDL